MSNEEYKRQRRLDRRAGRHGLSVRHRRAGYYFRVIETNATWAKFGSFHSTLDAVEEILNGLDKSK